jgi:murein L,D-transpeptidase YcbB/YkuD
VIGRATFEQLNTPLAHRIRQIELSLERLRWIPPLEAELVIAVNIPEYRLRALDRRQGRLRVPLDMRVIVGRAVSTETPVFLGTLRAIEFSPYWNVPASIVKNELVPRLRRDPEYLQREGMELVGGDRAPSVTTVVSAANLRALSRGELRLRQRPGPRNVLGGVKFPLSSGLDIYLHGTSDPALFARSRRDLSHGCIRIEEPVELARLLLEDKGEWTIDRIREAMDAGQSHIVRLSKSTPVVVFYTTAVVEPDGRTLFLRDIYGHDQALDRALRAHASRGSPPSW